MGGWLVGWLGGVKLKLKLNSAQLKLELGLSLEKVILNLYISVSFCSCCLMFHDHSSYLLSANDLISNLLKGKYV